jgi:hypothetical protein
MCLHPRKCSKWLEPLRGGHVSVIFSGIRFMSSDSIWYHFLRVDKVAWDPCPDCLAQVDTDTSNGYVRRDTEALSSTM